MYSWAYCCCLDLQVWCCCATGCREFHSVSTPNGLFFFRSGIWPWLFRLLRALASNHLWWAELPQTSHTQTRRRLRGTLCSDKVETVQLDLLSVQDMNLLKPLMILLDHFFVSVSESFPSSLCRSSMCRKSMTLCFKKKTNLIGNSDIIWLWFSLLVCKSTSCCPAPPLRC